METKAAEGYDDSLALFTIPPRDIGYMKEEWIDFAPMGSITDDSPIEFSIDANSLRYIDLNKTLLNIKFKVVDKDGKDIKTGDPVAPVNLTLHSLWRQVDVSLNQVPLPSVGTNYPYKAMLDVLLNKGSDAKMSQLQAQLYYKDTAGFMNTVGVSSNKGFNWRMSQISKSKSVEMEGSLFLDKRRIKIKKNMGVFHIAKS